MSNGITNKIPARDWLWGILVIFSIGVAWGTVALHTQDESVHSTYEHQAEKFIPRTEFEAFKSDVVEKIDRRLERIESKLGTLPSQQGD